MHKLTVLFLLISSFVQAQHLFTSEALNYHPSFAGQSGAPRASLVLSNNISSLGYDTYAPKLKGGIGFQIKSRYSLLPTSAEFIYSPKLTSRGNFTISPSIRIGTELNKRHTQKLAHPYLEGGLMINNQETYIGVSAKFHELYSESTLGLVAGHKFRLTDAHSISTLIEARMGHLKDPISWSPESPRLKNYSEANLGVRWHLNKLVLGLTYGVQFKTRFAPEDYHSGITQKLGVNVGYEFERINIGTQVLMDLPFRNQSYYTIEPSFYLNYKFKK